MDQTLTSSKRIAFLFAAGFLFIGQPFSFAQTPEGNACVSCHSDVWDDLKNSIHGQQGIFCNRCHGGDPTQTDQALAKAPGTGYIGIPDKKQTAQVCGECHADVETMNFYGTRTDQLARYKTSHHGKKLLLESDEKVAVCSDCHGHHDVVKVSEPTSPVYPLNVPKTCNYCHGKPKLMASYGLPSDILDTYKTSVHGVALLEKKDISVAHCASCHGSHGAVPPGVKDISSTCGKCHANEKKYFLESVHARASQEGKFSECISCHGNHGVQHPSPALYGETCVKCHEAGGQEARMGSEIARLFKESEEAKESSEGLVKQASVEGIFVEPESAVLEEIKTNVIEMAPVQHTLSLKKISELHSKIAEYAEGIRQSIGSKRRALEWRKKSLVLVWIFILVMVAALWTKYKRLKSGKHEKNKQDGSDE